MADHITITFGKALDPANTREYQVRAAPRSVSSAWRAETLKKLRFVVGVFESTNLADLLRQAGQGELAAQLQTGLRLNQIMALANAAQSLAFEFGGIPDWCWDQVCAYSADIAKDSEWINAHATDGEVIDAFKQILLELVIPLGGSLTGLAGLVRLATPTNSLSPSGESPALAAALKGK